jgi:adenosylcobinamide-phosphate synthase
LGREVSFLWKLRSVTAGKGPHREIRLFIWGFILLILAILPPVIISTGVMLLPLPVAIIISIPLLKGAFSLRGLFSAGREIQKALEEGDLEEARRLTGWHLVSRDTSELSESNICACIIESVAENLTDSVISPLYWFLAAGLPGAWFCRAVNTCDAMIAYREGDYEWGGKAAARLDDLIHWLPARITALSICLAACTYQRTSGKRAWAVMKADRNNTASPNAGWTMAAAAGALGVGLEKKDNYSLNQTERESTLEDLAPLFNLIIRAALGGIIFPLLLLGGTLWLR